MDPLAETDRATSDLLNRTDLRAQDVHTTTEKAAPAHTGCGAVLVLGAVSVASLSGLMLGYEMGLISGVLLQLREVLSLSCPQQEQAVGALLLGAFMLSVAGGTIVDRYGRRFSIILTAALCACGTLLSVCAPSFWTLVVGRVLVGMAVALSGTAACLYIAEVAPAAWRGRCVCVYELMVVLGVLLGFGLSWAFAGTVDGWRFTLSGVLLPAFLQMAIMPVLPQSPRFLLTRHRQKEARKTLARLRGTVPDGVEEEMKVIMAALGAEHQQGFLDLFRSQANMRRRMFVGMALVFLQQATGQPNLLAYASTVLRGVGFHSNEAATLASTGLGVVKLVGTVPAILLVDRVGPKAFLCVGAVVMTLSTAALGGITLHSQTQVASLCQSPGQLNQTPAWRGHDASIRTNANHADFLSEQNNTHLPLNPFKHTQVPWILNYTKDHRAVVMNSATPAEDSWKERTEISLESMSESEVSPSLKWISLVSLLIYVAAFSFSLGPMVYVVLSEIFPTGIRGKAVSVVSAFNWVMNLLISMTFLTLTEKIGLPSVIFSYAAMSFVLLIFVIVFVPETKGRSLEQISKELAMKNHLDSTMLCHPWRKKPKSELSQDEKSFTSV
ncbi:solute carrier family 2, facilitated glucose transporter member 12 [Hemibagrus wyckioides]|nr:solute carrier family 2, facilitated glucose transporter member 12 [Hemibagrus wyckioides]XP_058266213.1 solute carrier family 2, facilitated glucose transporter member 12 [Hemibagrus wyckioides]XP_058266214.1 solute carrier family 2, facilitated glucose transporter member 12 [Hemibagrus wyckioides]